MERYRSLNSFFKEKFGQRIQKIPIDAGLGCPNRDGTISDRGCIFCDRRGSGTGAMIDKGISISKQVEEWSKFLDKRYGAKRFIAYFQSFTNTYGPINKLKGLYDEALRYPNIVGLAIGTRPDCIDKQILNLISTYKNRYMVWIELGLQSAHDKTLRLINRGHDVECFERAVKMCSDYGIDLCVHIILGLPGEDREMMIQTAQYISKLPIWGIKIHHLYITRGTQMEVLWKSGRYRCLERDAYIDIVVDILEYLPPDMVIHRLIGDPIPSELVAPQWSLEKNKTLHLIRKRLQERNTYQGKLYKNH
ncbi:MAG TPA: TIGR01212 family radical SAM protein [Desulfobacteraceae bacterium]|nr:TIGR01212 family radical SAM protein [Desulfobacteraceae bacterium]